MLVVSDTSPLTALLQIGRAELLPALFGRVVIPPAVQRELLRAHAALPPWLEVRTSGVIPESLRDARLDAGETEALALALEIRADIVLMDERLGRRAARALGLRVMGLLGLLVLAKQRGKLSSVRATVDDLRSVAGCWFDDDLVAEVCASVGEHS